MGLRPARTCRVVKNKAWSRFSKKTPRKSFVKALPHNSLNVFSMGVTGAYGLRLDLVADYKVQVRDNSLESARQAANKYLEKKIPGNYFLKILVFPHNVLRENKMVSGAGADRIQKGMRQSFGRPTDRAAVIRGGQVLFSAFVNEANVPMVQEAYKRARGKLPGAFSLVRLKNTDS